MRLTLSIKGQKETNDNRSMYLRRQRDRTIMSLLLSIHSFKYYHVPSQSRTAHLSAYIRNICLCEETSFNGLTYGMPMSGLSKHTRHNRKARLQLRLTFFGFSSDFNTIQPQLLVQKLKTENCYHLSFHWTLITLLQHVRLNGVLLSVICANTGAHQGKILPTFLFSLYITDCKSTDE